MRPEGFEYRTPETTPDQLLETADPIELRKRLNDFLKENEGNEDKLKELVELLGSLEEKMGSDEKNDVPSSHIFDLGKIEQLYDTTVVKKKRITFTMFLQEYVRGSIRLLLDKFGQYNKTIEKNKIIRESKEQERQEKENLAETTGEIRQEITTEMTGRMIPATYSPADKQRVSNFENKIKTRNKHADGEQQEFLEEVLEQELILGKIMEQKSLFGPDVPVYHTDKYDDYFTHADLAVPAHPDFQILIDLTHSQGDAGEKLHYNRQHPVRKLSYPSNPEITGQAGIPIVIGMTEADAEDTINQFLENSAKEKLGQKNMPSQSEIMFQKNMERWFEYILIQLRYQRDYIQEHLEEKNKKGESINNLVTALELYTKALNYFGELKKGHSSHVDLSEKHPWDKRILSLEETIGDYLDRQGRANEARLAPDLADFSAVA